MTNDGAHLDTLGTRACSPRSLTLPALIEGRAQAFGSALAICDGDQRVSFSELHERTGRLASWLAQCGVAGGDRVALLLLDGIASIELMIACARLGAIAVPLNWRLAEEELRNILVAAQPRLLFRSAAFADLDLSGTQTAVFEIPDRPRPDSDYEQATAGAGLARPCQSEGGDPLFMLFTSGTTGRPKGCVQSHEGLVAAGMAFALRLGLQPHDRLLSTSPLFHVGGLGHVFAAIAAGAGIVFVPRGATHDEALDLASREGCTFGSMNDGLVHGLCDAQDRRGLALRLRCITKGAGMTTRSQIERIEQSLGCSVIGGYGQTEALGFILTIDGAAMLDNPTALGAPLPHVEVALLDDAGHPIEGEGTGEIAVRGPAVMLGYWQDPDATAATLASGWLHTGDIARRDAQGLLHFAGRTKELVKTGGENVYPREVEQVLLTHPAVLDAAIFGVPDEKWGETVKACIVLRGEVAPAELVSWCRAHIAGYKRPRLIEFIDAIPRDHLGKTQRPLLQRRPVTADQRVD